MAKSTDLEQVVLPIKKGKRGRPKGSTNNSTPKKSKGKRGRPKGSTNNTTTKRGRKPKGYSVNPTFQTLNDNLLIRLPQSYKQIIFITSDKKKPEILFVDL